jgi:hypothetical protein
VIFALPQSCIEKTWRLKSKLLAKAGGMPGCRIAGSGLGLLALANELEEVAVSIGPENVSFGLVV